MGYQSIAYLYAWPRSEYDVKEQFEIFNFLLWIHSITNCVTIAWSLQWNLKITKGQGTDKMYPL